MKIVKFVIALALLIGLSFIGKTVIENVKQTENQSLYTEVFKQDNGFGYQILTNNKILIKQNFIPAIQGEHPFKSKEEAVLVAELVKKQLLENKSPIVSTDDLSNLKIDTTKY